MTKCSAPSAYVAALNMLARRELSEAQVRQRLAAREHDEEAIDAAIARLRAEGAVNDERVANALARTESTVRGRGKLRVRRDIERAGIAAAVAKRATDEAFSALDPDQHLESALSRRLRTGHIMTEAEFRRLYRYLISQGFESERVLRLLKARSVK